MQWIALLLILSQPTLSYSEPVCGEIESQSEIYKSFKQCESARFNSALTKISQPSTSSCGNLIEASKDPKKLLGSLCSDPNTFACSRNHGVYLNSKCELALSDPKDISNSPAYVAGRCSFETKKEAFLKSHRDSCTESSIQDGSCNDLIKIKYAEEILELEQKEFYTPERVQKLKSTFDLVLGIYKEKISQSKTIRPDMKTKLISRISETTVLVPPFEGMGPPECANTGPTGPESGIYNDQNSHIVFCVGAAAMIDNMNLYDLIHTLGHELSHSIDPCALEQAALAETTPDSPLRKGDPTIGMDTYRGLISCLRGGKGPRACEGSVLHCNSEKALEDAKNEQLQYASMWGPNDSEDLELKKQISARYEATPDCDHGKSDPTQNQNDLSQYRKDSEPVEQIRESFSDFMGSEIAGEALKRQLDKGKLSPLDQADALSSISADYARLHGGCENVGNTNDPHPPGAIRLNRVIMSSESFRKNLSCNQGPPKTKFAQTSCKGI